VTTPAAGTTPAPGTALPFTGSNIALLVQLGLLMLLGGAVLVIAPRKSRPAHARR
jgi:predicted phage tail protein